MKKLIILLFSIILMVNNVQSQENESTNGSDETGFYGRAGVGYGFGLCYYDPCCYYDESNYSPSYDNVKAVSLMWGRGINAEIAVGYYLSRYIAVELAIRDFWGANVKKTSEGGSGAAYFSETNKFHAMVLAVNPSVVISPGFEEFNPYARIGASIGVLPKIYRKETNITGNITYASQGVYYGHIPIGYDLAGGVKWNIADNISLYGELEFMGMNYSPAHYKMTKYTIDGEDHFDDLTTKQTHVDYVKSYDKLETISNDSHNKRLKQSFPLTSVGINFGVDLRF